MKPINPKTLLGIIAKAESQPAVGGIVISSHNKIYYIHNGEELFIGERKGNVLTFALCEGRIYDAGEYDGVYDTAEDSFALKRERPIDILASHNGELYSAERCDCGNSIICKLNTPKSATVAQRKGRVLSLVSHNGVLFDSGEYDLINDTLKHKLSRDRGNAASPYTSQYPGSPWHAFRGARLASIGNKLYDASVQGVFETLENKIVYGLERKKEEPKKRRSKVVELFYRKGVQKSGNADLESEFITNLNDITSFVSHNNCIYLANSFLGMDPECNVLDVFNKKVVDNQFFESINCLLSHDGELYACGSKGLWLPLREQGQNQPLCKFNGNIAAVASVPEKLRKEFAERGITYNNNSSLTKMIVKPNDKADKP